MAAQPISADFPYAPHYVEIHGSRMHYIEEGQWRSRAVPARQPDLVVSVAEYYPPRPIPCALYRSGSDRDGQNRTSPISTIPFLITPTYVEGFIETLGLQNLTLVIHDWGSALGFHYAMRNEANIKALAFMEAILMPIPSWDAMPPDLKRDVSSLPDTGGRLGHDRQSAYVRGADLAPRWSFAHSRTPNWTTIGLRTSTRRVASRCGVGQTRFRSRAKPRRRRGDSGGVQP